MRPWEIQSALSTAEDKESILRRVPKDDPFWIGASFIMDPFVGIPVRMTMVDPPAYGTGLPVAALDKLMAAILQKRLSAESLVVALEKVSRACTEREWTLWVKPILTGTAVLPLDPGLFNKYAPGDCHLPPFPISEPKPVASMRGLPDIVVLEPVVASKRAIWFFEDDGRQTYARTYGVDGSPMERHVLQGTVEGLSGTVVDVYDENDLLIVRDLLTIDQLRSQSATATFGRRRKLLSDFAHALNARFDLPFVSPEPAVEFNTRNQFTAMTEEIDLLLQRGFSAIVLRDVNAQYGYRQRGDYLVQPKGSTTLTCTGVSEGTDDKYRGRAWSIHGTGKRGKKEVRGEVCLGLNWEERGIIWPSRSNYQGRTFEVTSCGADETGELVFPVFKRWKKYAEGQKDPGAG